MIVFQCPRCHGPYFGVYYSSFGDTTYCHCAADGSHLDMTPDTLAERKAQGLPRQTACGWRGAYEFGEDKR